MVIAYTYVYLWLSVISVEKYINMKYAAFISVDDHRSFHPSHIYEWTNGSIMHIYCKSILGRQQVSGRQGNMSPPPFRRWRDYLSLPLTLFSRRHMSDVIAYTIWLIQGINSKWCKQTFHGLKSWEMPYITQQIILPPFFPGPLKPRITHFCSFAIRAWSISEQGFMPSPTFQRMLTPIGAFMMDMHKLVQISM